MVIEAFGEVFIDAASDGGATDGAQEAARQISDTGLAEPTRTELMYEEEALSYLRGLREYIDWMIHSDDPAVVGIRGDLILLREELDVIIKNGIPQGEIREVVMGIFNDLDELERVRIQTSSND